jgi:hypothetical protein
VRGIQDVIADPDAAVTTCIPYIPGSADKRDQLRAVLDATIPLMESPNATQQGYGYSNPASWQNTVALLRKLGFLGSDVDPAKSFSNDYLPTK